jgi:hypothetical protein
MSSSFSSTTRRTNSSTTKQQHNELVKNKKKKMSVQFSHVEIRDMPMVLGQHPPSGGGAPLELDWEPIQIRQLPIVDLYEQVYKQQGDDGGDDPVVVVRSGESELLPLSPWDRAEILLRAGYSLNEIAQGSQDAQLVWKQRDESSRLLVAAQTKSARARAA